MWWALDVVLVIYVALAFIDRVLVRRGIDDIGPHARCWADRTCGFMMIGWLCHYLPFFLMVFI